MVQPLKKEEPTPPVAAPVAAPKAVLWGLTRNQVIAIAAVVVAANLPLIHYFLLRPNPPITAQIPFVDDFNRAELGPNYQAIGGLPRIINGWLQSPGVKNNTVWLQASLPQNVRVEFDAKSESPTGDIKVEIFGNGWDHGSGYTLVFGGWSNSISVLARLDQHGEPLDSLTARQRRGEASIGANTAYRVERREPRVVPNRPYHFRIERAGGDLRWYLDNDLFLELNDPYPLVGPWHDRFGFSEGEPPQQDQPWDSIVFFDNLSITPL